MLYKLYVYQDKNLFFYIYILELNWYVSNTNKIIADILRCPKDALFNVEFRIILPE